jgi:hypothetical protein
MSKKLYNPQAHVNSFGVPNWLSQVPVKLLSHGAKALYCRLCKWAGYKGTAHRSAPLLGKELGESTRQIERFLKELRDCELIGTFQIKKGGENHFEFYQHEWMNETITDELLYKNKSSEDPIPPDNMSVPPRQYVGTPPTNTADINNKEIKTNKIKDIYIGANDVVNDWDHHETVYEEKNKADIDEKDQELSFVEFWSAYPVKKSQGRARIAWVSQRCHLERYEILEKLSEQLAKDSQYLQGYAPNPDKYLMQEKWKDEIHIRKSRTTTILKPRKLTLEEVINA